MSNGYLYLFRGCAFLTLAGRYHTTRVGVVSEIFSSDNLGILVPLDNLNGFTEGIKKALDNWITSGTLKY